MLKQLPKITPSHPVVEPGAYKAPRSLGVCPQQLAELWRRGEGCSWQLSGCVSKLHFPAALLRFAMRGQGSCAKLWQGQLLRHAWSVLQLDFLTS